MHGKVKLSKRQIKEDKFTTFMLTSREQVTENWQYWAIGAVAVILAVIAVVFFARTMKSGHTVAGENYSQAVMELRNGNTQVAILKLNQLVDDNKDADVTQQAVFMLGRVNFDQRNYTEAIRYWEQYISKYKDNKLNYAAAIAGIAAANENQGMFAQAAAKYLEAVSAWPDGAAAPDYKMAAMRAYLEAGDRQNAQKILDEIKTQFKNTETALKATRMFSEKSSSQIGS
jgi:TolA-binding protein